MSATIIDTRSTPTVDPAVATDHPHREARTGRTAGIVSLTAVGLCVVGAVLQQTSGADLYAAMETTDRAIALGHLSDVAGAKTQLMMSLGVWMVAFPMFATAGVLLADMGTSRRLARLARTAFTASLAAIVVFLGLLMTFVAVVAPLHEAGDDVWAVARVVGFSGSTIDWLISALVMGFGPAAAVWAGRDTWAPRWLQRFAAVTFAVAVVELIALAFDNRSLVFIIVPVGLAHMAAAGVAAIRSGN